EAKNIISNYIVHILLRLPLFSDISSVKVREVFFVVKIKKPCLDKLNKVFQAAAAGFAGSVANIHVCSATGGCVR
ncbi:MAG: hypothetical protein PUH13_09980, partial [Treponema sp.]|nr:hypothetical protein [Treponema sp.]